MGEPDYTVGLSFIDVLYGLAATSCFTSAFAGPPLTATGWSHFAVAMSVITLSWVGYHVNRHREAVRRGAAFVPGYFCGWCKPLWHLLVDVALLALYYVLAVEITPRPDMEVELRLLFMIFAGYVAWDLLDLEWDTWRDKLWWLLAEVAFAGTFAVGWLAFRRVEPARATAIVVLDLVVIALLFAFRIVEDRLYRLSRRRQE